MSPATELIEIAREGLLLALVLALPLLGAALAAALFSGLLQAFTRISEPVLTHVPRIVAVMLAALVAAPWIGHRVAGFADRVWSLVQWVGP